MQKLKVTEAMNKPITSAIHRLRMTTFVLLLALTPTLHAADKLRALIVDGQNNHKVWPKSTVMMKQYLETTGMFAVDVVRTKFIWSADREAALRHLGDALAHWKQYAAIRDAHYVPALYNRIGYVNVTELTEKVAADLDIARNWKPGSLKDDGKRTGSERGFRK